MSIRNESPDRMERLEDLRLQLQARHLWPGSSDVFEHIEDAMQDAVEDALPSVHPSDRFRQNLRENLNLAAQRQVQGLMIEYPRPFREAVIIGISIALFATFTAALVFALRSHLVGAER